MKNLSGRVLANRFYLGERLGQGGSGDVYLAEDRACGLPKRWVVKWVDRRQSGPWFEYYKNEVKVLAAVSHPNMTTIHYFGEEAEGFYMVLDYIEGENLKGLLERAGPVDEKRALNWMKTICAVLACLHEARGRPIIYCDLNPGNIMVSREDVVYLMDYGIAREMAAEAAPALGTRGFAAPEQYGDGSGMVDERTDIYGVGATLFNLLTADLPLETIHPRSIAPTVSVEMDALVAKCLCKNPEGRYQSMAQLRQALESIGARDALLEKRRLTILMSVLLAAAFCLISMLGALALMRSDAQRTGKAWELSGDERWARQDDIGARTDYLRGVAADPENQALYEKIYRAMASQEAAKICEVFRNKTEIRYLDAGLALNLAMQGLEAGQEPWLSYGEALLEAAEKKGSGEQRALAGALKPLLQGEDGREMASALGALKNFCEAQGEAQPELRYLLLTLFERQGLMGEEFDRIAEGLEAYAEQNGDFYGIPKIYKLLASHYYRQAQEETDPLGIRWALEKAQACLEALGEVASDKETWILKGRVQLALGDTEKAQAFFERARQQNPQDPQILIELTRLCLGRDKKAAMTYYNQLLALKEGEISKNLLSQINALEEALAMEE
ncbi:MAG: protein kinase [Eubacterium sp.]|nr:protein kinase [Eubacterium sp.]